MTELILAMASGVMVRVAREADLDGLVTIINRAFVHEDWLIPGPRISRPELASELRSSDRALLVAERRGRLAGCVRVVFGPGGRNAAGASSCTLGLLAVAPAHQGRGVGAILVAAAEDAARKAGFEAMILQCGRELGMPSYYAALGYRVVATQFGYQLGSTFPFHLVTMRRVLSPPVRIHDA